VVTVEDPVEYVLPAISNQVHEAADLAAGLRAILRQDPDIIMVGNRDNETAETAVRAALTGHLVFTTLRMTPVVRFPVSKILAPGLLSDASWLWHSVWCAGSASL